MGFFDVYLYGLMAIMIMMVFLWVISIFIKNVSIVDPFWGLGFIVASVVYYLNSGGTDTRKIIVLILVAIWGLRLSIYLFSRNIGKGEDFRYQEFRKKYGPDRYWWISFFQTFLLQGVLMWLISVPLLAAMFYGNERGFNAFDMVALVIWLIGFVFEAGGDYQLSRFKSDKSNKGKVLDKGFWKYTRHPNYFGDATVWWGFGLFSVAAESYWPFLGSILMTFLIIKVSGVALLEKSLKDKKSAYADYVARTNAFFPWFPKK